jgi:hypothetical protein
VDIRPETLAATYDYLRLLTPQFRRLPPADDVEFHVIAKVDRYGDYSQWLPNGAHIIRISTAKHAHLMTLMQTVAHEMVHLAQSLHKTTTPNVMHNDDFYRRARAVCRAFGWDEKAF